LSHPNEVSSSLWEAFHDATVVETAADPMARRVVIVLDHEVLRDFAQLSKDVRWRLTIDEVVVLLARTWQPWPGPVPNLKGLTRNEESAIVAEYQAKGRQVSIGWVDFERATKKNGIWLKDAKLREGDSAVVLSAYGHEENTDRYLEFEVTGKALRCERTDIGPVPLADLLRLGEAFWAGFDKRQRESAD
jgi:hypothetical protein